MTRRLEAPCTLHPTCINRKVGRPIWTDSLRFSFGAYLRKAEEKEKKKEEEETFFVVLGLFGLFP